MTNARELIAIGGAGRYRIIEVEAPRSARAVGIGPEWLISILEEFHREGWEVCGHQLVGSRHGSALWITYRRRTPL